MPTLYYTPDEDLKVHEENAIRIICKSFQSHENGLPEWVKNSSDAYISKNSSKGKRIILVIITHGSRISKSTISCLDFVGMTSDDIDIYFRHWASPDAAAKGAEIDGLLQGGHGNGGKCYMTQMFEDFSSIYTVKNGLANHYGVAGNSILFGYIPDKDKGRNIEINNSVKELEKILKKCKISQNSLSSKLKNVISNVQGFTIITGVGPKGFRKKLSSKDINNIKANLEGHPQMLTTLELCEVYMIENGNFLNDGKPLTLPPIKPMKGAEEPRVYKISEELKDPITGTKIRTIEEENETGKLTLYTSKASMRRSKKERHNITYKTSAGYIGYIPVTELDVVSPFCDRIFGNCDLEALEPFKQNDRSRLVKSPLTRAVEKFISKKVNDYGKEFEKQDQRKYNQDEKDVISEMNNALDKWKNRFLNEYMQGLWGAGTDGPHPPSPSLPNGISSRIDIRLSHHYSGLGVSFSPSIRFFDKEGRHIRATPYRWYSEDTNVAMVDEDLLIIDTYSIGETIIYAETLDGSIKSNKVLLEVVDIRDIEILPSHIEVPVGSRSKFDANCQLGNGKSTSDVYLIWTESDPNIARVSASGMIYGFTQGEVNICAGDDRCMANKYAVATVIEGIGRDKGDKKGRGFPLVLVSGEIDRDPDTDDYVHLSKDDPPIYQGPLDANRNIWWINSSSPLARMYLDKRAGYGYQSREWRMYHLERFVDVIVQISLTQGPEANETISVNEWIMKWGAQVAEIQEAAVLDLSEFISQGDLPLEEL